MPNAGIVGGGHSGSESKAVFKMINVLFQGFCGEFSVFSDQVFSVNPAININRWAICFRPPGLMVAALHRKQV